MSRAAAAQARPRVGISSCLLGEAVRWDGSHRRQEELLRELGPRVEWLPVCPELELGLGVPREPIHLVDSGTGLQLLGRASGREHGQALEHWARERLACLFEQGLCGYVLKSRSPSCGLRGVPVLGADGRSRALSRGRFAALLLQRFPGLPVAEEEELSRPAARERWLAEVLAYQQARSGRGPEEGPSPDRRRCPPAS